MNSGLFEWSDRYGVGVEEIDGQHKELVELLNQLHTGMIDRRGSAALRKILDELVGYTRAHFSVEESLMRVSNYPEFDAHKRSHEELMAQIDALQERLDSGEEKINVELLLFLKMWLTSHINDADKQFGAYFASIGGAPRAAPQPQGRAEEKAWWWKWIRGGEALP